MVDLFPPSIAFVLGNETYMRNSKIVSVFEDPKTGECSNWGISLKWYRSIKPQAAAADIKALTQEGATWLYRQYFWSAPHLDRIALGSIAARVLDLTVNQGSPHGVECLQRALGIKDDGVLGPVTAAACNSANEVKLYDGFCAQAEARYRAIHLRHVDQFGQEKADSELDIWLKRLAKRPITAVSTTA